MESHPVTFFHPYPEEVESAETVSLEDWTFWSQEGKERRRAWILQTYLRLSEAGYDVSLSSTLPKQGIVVVAPEEHTRQAFFNQFSANFHRDLLLVTVRADIVGFRSPYADADIVQNGRFADDERVFFVPHWPQPGLIPRDPARKTKIENIVFKGGFGSLRAEFRSERWYQFLDEHNLSFKIHSKHTTPEGEIPPWHDYSDADLVLAVRPEFNDGGLRPEKPASKLVNAWHAGVPALLGPEYAFRELRKSELDYIEVDSISGATQAISRLLSDPEYYNSMKAHAQKRAQEFTTEKITQRWSQVLYKDVPRLLNRKSVQWSRSLPLGVRQVVNLLASPPAPFEIRKMIGHYARHT